MDLSIENNQHHWRHRPDIKQLGTKLIWGAYTKDKMKEKVQNAWP